MEETGNELLMKKLNQCEELIRMKGQKDLSFYRGRDMIQIFRRYWQIILFYRATYLEIYQREPQCQFDINELQQEFDTYQKLGERVNKELAVIKSYQYEKEIKVKKIQKMYREKKDVEWDKLKLEFNMSQQ